MIESLRARIELWLIVPLTIVAALDVLWTLDSANETARLVQERLLIGSARMIGEQIRYDDGILQIEIPPAAIELFASSPIRDSVYYRVESPRGRVLAGNFDLKPPRSRLPPDESVFYSSSVRGIDVYVVAYAQPVLERSGDESATVLVAQTLNGRHALAKQIWERAILGHMATLFLVAGLAWLGIGRSLRALRRFQMRLSNRRPGSLEPLTNDGIVTELRPLVEVVNGYISRLETYVSAQERFISNAAHQLRTPLTVLSTQVVYGRRSGSLSEMSEALSAMERTVQYAVRLVNQLLSLDLAQTRSERKKGVETVDLLAVTKLAMEELAISAQQRNVDLGYEGSRAPAMIQADPILARELVSNLVDNAIRYGGKDGSVTVFVLQRQACVELRVEDRGPGIPDDEKDKVFQRFYRLNNSQSDGSGLGLAIVKEIVDGCGASIQLRNSNESTGLIVSVCFPREIPRKGA